MNNKKIKTAIIGPGNIGTDLMYKITTKSQFLDLQLVVGIYENSKGLKLAQEQGIETSARGIDAILERDDIGLVFDATFNIVSLIFFCFLHSSIKNSSRSLTI